jgi:hypothetical protein
MASVAVPVLAPVRVQKMKALEIAGGHGSVDLVAPALLPHRGSISV